MMKSEWGIIDGQFQDENGHNITRELAPYPTWFEALPYCVNALRKDNPKSEAATMLEMKYHIRHRRYGKAQATAKAWIKDVDPDCGYCYYVLSMAHTDDRVGLSWSKKVRAYSNLARCLV